MSALKPVFDTGMLQLQEMEPRGHARGTLLVGGIRRSNLKPSFAKASEGRPTHSSPAHESGSSA